MIGVGRNRRYTDDQESDHGRDEVEQRMSALSEQTKTSRQRSNNEFQSRNAAAGDNCCRRNPLLRSAFGHPISSYFIGGSVHSRTRGRLRLLIFMDMRVMRPFLL